MDNAPKILGGNFKKSIKSFNVIPPRFAKIHIELYHFVEGITMKFMLQ